MTTPLVLGDITIHPVIEQQGAFFDALSFFPKLKQRTARREPGLAAAGIYRCPGQVGALYSELRHQDAAP